MNADHGMRLAFQYRSGISKDDALCGHLEERYRISRPRSSGRRENAVCRCECDTGR